LYIIITQPKLILMKNIFCLFVFLALASCDYTRDRSDENDTSETSDATTTEDQELFKEDMAAVTLEYFDTINVHDTDMVIIPIGAWKEGTARSKGRSLNLDNAKMKFGGYGYRDNYHRYFNLLFYNVKKDTSYLFFDNERAIINEISPNVNKNGEFASRFIFYDIRNKDYNMDGKLNNKDSHHLFVSNKEGQNLIQLTPNNSQLRNWTIIKKSNIVIAKVLMDSNDDKKFDTEKDYGDPKGDRLRLIKIDLDNVKKGRPFLSPKTEEQLKEQFLDLMVKTK
jgi:hypothetical protein